MKNKKILGKFKIGENGVCKDIISFKFMKKIDRQLISGFIHVLRMIIEDYFGDKLEKIETSEKYTILFDEEEVEENGDKFLIVSILDKLVDEYTPVEARNGNKIQIII